MNNDIDQMHFLALHVGKAHCVGNWNYKQVCSPFTRIYYVTKGHALIELPDKVQHLYPDCMYIIPAFTPHSCVCEEEFDHYYIHIYNESDRDILDDWDLPTEIEAGENMLGYVQRLYELCPGMELQQYEPKSYDNSSTLSQNAMKNKQRKLAARIESRGIIYLLLASFMKTARPKLYAKDERIVEVMNYIRSHIGDKISIDVLANISCMSNDYLIRLFKKEMHMTPLYYITRKRVERAQLRLITEITSVKEIAYQLGFEDQAYFNRVFKRITGLSPLAYRKNCQ